MKVPLIGVSSSIEKIRDLIKHIANTGLNVIISGESGVGKEVVAQSLYYASSRNKNPFIKVNCAALPDGLLESELFGYEKGAFTGAVQSKKGKFELASKGVLFLDEIGEMSNLLQAKLLHVLQSGEYARLGAENEIKSDTWVITASNRTLEDDIKSGIFRKDLYYRLSTIKIHIPPLRERTEDIPCLLEHYFNQYKLQFNREKSLKLSKTDIEILTRYPWPGNVRELQNLLKRFIVIGGQEEIINELLYEKNVSINSLDPGVISKEPNPIGQYSEKTTYPADLSSFSLKDIKKKAANCAEKEAISYILAKTNWNRSKAAKLLKISYKTLLLKINTLAIKP